MNMLRGLLVAALAVLSAPCWGGPVEEAGAALDRWAAAFSANDTDAVAKSYAEDAVLIPVYATSIDYGRSAIIHHFVSRLAGSGNKVVISERRLTILSDNAVLATGLAEFTVHQNSKIEKVPSRFTFVVVKRDGGWLLAHQHTSMIPAARH